MKSHQVHEEVDKTLAALDYIKRAEVSADFEKILMQKLSFLPQRTFVKLLKVSVAAMILMALANFFVLSSLSEDDTTTREAYIEILGDEWLYQADHYITQQQP